VLETAVTHYSRVRAGIREESSLRRLWKRRTFACCRWVLSLLETERPYGLRDSSGPVRSAPKTRRDSAELQFPTSFINSKACWESVANHLSLTFGLSDLQIFARCSVPANQMRQVSSVTAGALRPLIRNGLTGFHGWFPSVGMAAQCCRGIGYSSDGYGSNRYQRLIQHSTRHIVDV
jgi:hypothetical protein